MVARGYKGIQGITRGDRVVIRDYSGLQRMPRVSKGLREVIAGYKRLQEVTGVYMALPGVTTG